MGLFVGVDLGSTGIRGIVIDSEGQVVVDIQEPISRELLYEGCDTTLIGRHEQNPWSWIEKNSQLLQKLVKRVEESEQSVEEIRAICTDSTSGSIVAIDEFGTPLTPALMYNDIRAQKEAELVQSTAKEFSEKVGYKFQASFSLPKILWIKNYLPEIYKHAARFLHANDYLVGLMTGEYWHSDSSNCLKAGYDFIDNKWPDFIEQDLGISLEKLPKVVSPGEIVGKTNQKLESETGFPENVLVISGATDSTTALIASGASEIGDIFTSLGTTLVTRVMTQELIRDPQGRVYCHIFPGKKRIFLPGGASSVGGECLSTYFPGIDYEIYDEKALSHFPSNSITYPLVKKGERFPFVNSNAEHFYEGSEDIFEKYTSYLQAVAFVERLSVHVLESLGATVSNRVFTIGGAVKSYSWLQIRADVLQKPIYRPKVIQAAYGAAILAASTILFNGDLSKAVKTFVQPDLVVEPRIELKDKIDKHYNEFLSEIMKRFKFQI